MNLQCMLIPTVPTTTVTTTTTTATTTIKTTPPPPPVTPRTTGNAVADTLLRALELCNSLGGFVPFNFLTKSQTSGQRLLQGENTPDIFDANKADDVVKDVDDVKDVVDDDVSNEIEVSTKNEKLIQVMISQNLFNDCCI